MSKSSAAVVRQLHLVVDARDQGRCRRCGREVGEWFSRQHRIPRGAGGSARVDRPSNLITLCGSATSSEGCHNWAEHGSRTDAELLGYLLPKLNPDIDPELEPVFTHEFGWVLLDDAGNITPCAEPRREVG
jgi:5-methylcytosine-specific restriction protein A